METCSLCQRHIGIIGREQGRGLGESDVFGTVFKGK